MDVDEFAPRLSFFWNAHNNFFEEVAKFRAARRIWYRLMTERFGAKKESAKLLRFHTQTGGSHADRAAAGEQRRPRGRAVDGGGDGRHAEPAHQRLRRGAQPADRAGGAQSRCARSRSSATRAASPTRPIRWPARYFVETLTDEVERLAWEYIDRIDEMGGAVEAHRGRLPDGRDRAGRVRVRQVDRRRRAGHRRRQQVHGRRRAPIRPSSPSIPSSSAARRRRSPTYKAARDTARSRPGSPTSPRRRAARRTCCTR